MHGFICIGEHDYPCLSGFIFNLYLFSWNMLEPSNSFYTVEGGGTFWNMVEHCGLFWYHMHSITQQALLCSALHCFPQLIYNWVGNCFIMDFLFLVSLFSI